jgi:hypothetical protein
VRTALIMERVGILLSSDEPLEPRLLHTFDSNPMRYIASIVIYTPSTPPHAPPRLVLGRILSEGLRVHCAETGAMLGLLPGTGYEAQVTTGVGQYLPSFPWRRG